MAESSKRKTRKNIISTSSEEESFSPLDKKLKCGKRSDSEGSQSIDEITKAFNMAGSIMPKLEMIFEKLGRVEEKLDKVKKLRKSGRQQSEWTTRESEVVRKRHARRENQSKSLQMVCTVQIVEKESFQGIQIPKSNKCLLEGIPGIAAHGIRNPSEDWNPESKSHWQWLESSSWESGIYGVESRIQDCLEFPYMGRLRS